MKRIATAIVGLFLLPAWIFAANVSTISGTVQDASGRFIGGALVSVANAGPNGLDRMAFSDSRGVFSFENLVPGEYYVQVSVPHFVSQKEKIPLPERGNAKVNFTLQSLTDFMRRATSRDAKPTPQDIVLTLRSARGTQSVLRFSDSPSTPVFQALSPDYSGYIQFYSKADPGASTVTTTKGSRFSVTLGLPANAKVTVSGQYNESPLEPRGASAMYEFQPAEGHETRIGVDVRQGIVLDDAFTAEELKQFQGSYADKFHLGDRFVIEQGAQFGHAEGRASNNYFRPKGSIGWVANDKTVLTFGFTTQAPGQQQDDPVRSRESFEQVNLPPSYEHYLHTEVSATRFIDDSTKVSAALFKDQANYRALFVTAPDGRHGLVILDGKQTPSQGGRIFINREFKGFETGFGYTVATGPGISGTALSLDDVRSRIESQRFQVFTARIKTDIELTNTELTAVYRWVSNYAAAAIDPYQQNVEYNDPTLSISIAQNLPTFGAIPAKVQAVFDARNLLERPVGSSTNQLALSPRWVRGGINIRF